MCGVCALTWNASVICEGGVCGGGTEAPSMWSVKVS